jgi:hypothetical protein
MAYTTNFPTSVETFDTRAASDTIHEDDHNHIGATVEALEAKVGVDGSAVVTSHSYLLTHLPAQAQNWDIGADTLRAQKLIADGLTTGRVVFTTTDGELTTDADITFDTDTLTVTKIAAYTLTGKLTAGAIEIEGSNFDINGGDISAGTISGSLTWSAAQNLNRQALTNVNIDSGTIDGVTITSPTIATGIALPANAVDAITEVQTLAEDIEESVQALRDDIGNIPQVGSFAFTGPSAAATPVALTVTLPSGYFDAAPTVVATVSGINTSNAYFPVLHSITASQFQVRVWTTNATAGESLTLQWIAK